jgi:hypothetical protein
MDFVLPGLWLSSTGGADHRHENRSSTRSGEICFSSMSSRSRGRSALYIVDPRRGCQSMNPTYSTRNTILRSFSKSRDMAVTEQKLAPPGL